nr:integrase, catalytic region, zinc finger, CCHC-type, peptidase aspartic, catalytic [Tanacetum cinerariifolium]
MSRDVITVGSTMRIPLLYRGEYSQWREQFMNYLEEQTDGEAMINSIQNDDQPLPVIAPVSLARTAQNASPTLKDPKFWTAEGKKTRKIDHLARSLLIQGLPNDIYSLIDSNETAKDLCDALERCGYKNDNCELNYKFLNNLQPEWKQYGTIMRQTKNLMDINIDALYNILKQNLVTSYPLALVAEKTKVSKRKEKVEVRSETEGSDDEDIGDLKNITALLAKAFNRKMYYAKPTNNNLRTSLASSSANKKPEYVKTVEKKEDKKADEKKRDMSKVKCYNCKNEGHFTKDYKKAKVKDYNYYKTKMLLAKKDSDEQVLLAEDQAWMESSSDSDQEINANMVFMAQIKKVLSDSDESSSSAKETITEVAYYTSESKSESEFETLEYYDKSTNYGLFVNNDDDQETFHDAIESASENFIENHIDSQKDYDKSEVDHNDSKEKEHLVVKLIRKFNHKIAKSKDLRPSLYGEKVIGLGYTLMFLIHSDEALEIEKFKRARENKIEFAYDCGNLNASYQTSSFKPYVLTVNLGKIIIDLEDEVVSLLEKEKTNLKTIESLKSKGFELSENAISKSKNQSENDCKVGEKECDNVENPKMIAHGMFKLNTFSSVRRPKQSSVIWKKKGSSNTSNVDLSSVSHSKLNKDVKRYSRKDLLSCNNSHLGETSSAYVCNDAMNICLWIIDSGCSKHMTGNRALLTNFVEKFLGTVRFDNNDFAVITGYGDVVIGSMTIKKVYYVKAVARGGAKERVCVGFA